MNDERDYAARRLNSRFPGNEGSWRKGNLFRSSPRRRLWHVHMLAYESSRPPPVPSPPLAALAGGGERPAPILDFDEMRKRRAPPSPHEPRFPDLAGRLQVRRVVGRVRMGGDEGHRVSLRAQPLKMCACRSVVRRLGVAAGDRPPAVSPDGRPFREREAWMTGRILGTGPRTVMTRRNDSPDQIMR
jgi:hypothetical protein